MLFDRFIDSSLAYQGGGRALGVEQIRALNAFATGGLSPDRTLLLRIDPERGLAGIDGPAKPTGSSARGASSSPAIAQPTTSSPPPNPSASSSSTPTQPPDTVLAAALKALSMKHALDLLAAVFANPAGGAPLLDELRARWHELAPDERAALTPLAKLAAERVKAAPRGRPGRLLGRARGRRAAGGGVVARGRGRGRAARRAAGGSRAPSAASRRAARAAAAGRARRRARRRPPAARRARRRRAAPAPPRRRAPATARRRRRPLARRAAPPARPARALGRHPRVAARPARPHRLPARPAGGRPGRARRPRRARGHADRRRQEPLLPAARARERRTSRSSSRR